MRRLFAAVCTAILAAHVAGQEVNPGGEAMHRFQTLHPSAGLVHNDVSGRIERVYGPSLATAQTPEDSAAAFMDGFSAMFGDLGAMQLWHPTAEPVLPIGRMPGEQQDRFTIVSYGQFVSGIRVFRGEARLLVRNEPGYPLVLVSSGLRDLAGWRPAGGAIVGDARVTGRMQRNARRTIGREAVLVGDGERIIWAGVDDMVVEPRIAIAFVMENGTPFDGSRFQSRLFIADAATSDILHQESLVYDMDVEGSTGGLATEDLGADICDPESLTGLPHAQVNIVGGGSAFADAAGDFIIPHGGSAPVTVQSRAAGRYFNLDDAAGPVEVLSLAITPPGPANFVHNAANASEFIRAQVNAYVHSNWVRDTLLDYVPNYPVIATQTGFDINVNINDTCNAFYSPSQQSINFFRSGGGCPNTAFSTVVYHEYGHHMVAMGGSGQGAYGEGMSDSVAVCMTDSPCLGQGFSGNCNSCLRNADNDCQYETSGCSSCGSAIHSCGRLISGCVWDLRENLFVSEPSDYLDILRFLTFSSIPLHTGNSITPSITIDFITLDDNDGDITNGSPHYTEIADAFGQHNMPAPPLPAIVLNIVGDPPARLDPAGGTSFVVEISEITGQHQPGTGLLHFDDGSGFQSVPMNDLGSDTYEAVFPALPCGGAVLFYVSVESTNGDFFTAPIDAPSVAFVGISADSLDVVFEDDFETSQGWTVTNQSLMDGPWERGFQSDPGIRGTPPSDFDGSGRLFATDLAGGNADVDGGPTILTSPLFNLSDGASYRLQYARWFYNDDGDGDRLVIEISNNNGASWTQVESVADMNTGGWSHRTWVMNDLLPLTAAVRVRFRVADSPNDSVTEAAVDAFSVARIVCDSGTELTDVAVAFGTLVSGGLAELLDSDDSDLVADSQFGFSAQQPNIVQVDVGAMTTTASPAAIDLAVESRINNPGGTSRLMLMDWSTNQPAAVHEFAIGQTEIVETISGIAPGDFVRADGRVQMSNRIWVIATFSASGFTAEWDQVVVTVN